MLIKVDPCDFDSELVLAGGNDFKVRFYDISGCFAHRQVGFFAGLQAREKLITNHMHKNVS